MNKIIIFLLLFFSSISFAKNLDDFAYSDEWLYLLHYQKGIFGYKSSIDSTEFFLDKNGMEDPKAELIATIELFENKNEDERKCNFPARYKILKKNNIIKANYPKCKEYEEALDAMKPNGITLIFTNAYMNNPASLFGHTLIRIDTKRKGTQLLAHGANYGAFTGEDGGLLFALKGVFGGYFGSFTIRPYYDIINTYNNIENRDIWEYELNFTNEEMELFVDHLWEISKTKVTYYFLDKNCSYMILEMFDAIRPSLKLSENFDYYTLPLDTLKAVNSKEGFVKKANYRPSRQTKILNRVSQMNNKEYDSLLEIVKEDKIDLEKFTPEEKADILETAYQYIQYQFIEGEVELDDYRKNSFKILKERSKIKAKPSFNELRDGENPIFSHEPMELGIGAGTRNGDTFYEISYRLLYNTLLNDSFGLLKGAEINLLNLDARYYQKEDDFVLENFDLVKIKSLAPSSQLFSPLSFSLDFGVENFYNQLDNKDGYIANLDIGVGKAFETSKNSMLYFLVNNYLGAGEILPNNSYYAVGVEGGFYQDIGKIRLTADVEAMYGTHKIMNKVKYNFDFAYGITRNSSIGLSYNFDNNQYGENKREYFANIKFNF